MRSTSRAPAGTWPTWIRSWRITIPPPRRGRGRVQHRNALWSAWLRLPWRGALRRTGLLVLGQSLRSDSWLALADALLGAGWVFRERRPVARDLESWLRLLETTPNQAD